MARLLIGHTTHRSTRIWVRGSKLYPHAFVSLEGGRQRRRRSVRLSSGKAYTGVVDFDRLKSHTLYRCSVTFGASADTKPDRRIDYGQCTGRLRTAPSPRSESQSSFLLVSCNLHALGLVCSPDPAYETLAEVAASERVDFAIHCGDQIYYDVPLANKRPDLNEYRAKYLDAWGDSRATRRFLTQLPQYMILDDHEIIDNFANDERYPKVGATTEEIRHTSLRAYREFQHSHNPHTHGARALYYEFAHGRARFFVLDTRSERWGRASGGRTRMIGPTQERALFRWLKEHPKEVKFIVTSIPFVAEVKDTRDKWCSEPYLAQRERILRFLLENETRGVSFLTGDMHCSYHATLRIDDGERELVLHELMSSPVNQLNVRGRSEFETPCHRESLEGDFSYVSEVPASAFYGRESNAMLIHVRGRRVTHEIFRTKGNRRRGVRLGNYRV